MDKRKKVIKSTPEVRAEIEALPKIYLVGCWARCGVMEFPSAGKINKDGIPFVWQYDDFNGTSNTYVLREITNTTTGMVFCRTYSKDYAEFIADAINKDLGYKTIYNDNEAIKRLHQYFSIPTAEETKVH